MAEDGRKLLEALEGEWRDALCSKDLDRLRALVHPDFVLIGTRSSGPFTMGRDEWLDAIQRRDVETIDLEVRDATMLDQVMVGTVQARWRLKYLNRIIEDCVLLTDVWVLDQGRWRALRRHAPPSPGNGPSYN